MAKVKRTKERLEFDKALGERIKCIREEYMSREELARRLNISYMQLYKYESGSCSFSAFILKKISDILDISVDHLMG